MFKKKIEPVTDRLAHWGGGKIKFPEDLFWWISKKLARATQSYRKLPRASQSYRKLARATQSYGVTVAIAVVCGVANACGRGHNTRRGSWGMTRDTGITTQH